MKKIYAMLCLVGLSAAAVAQSVQTSPVKKQFTKDQISGLTTEKQSLPMQSYMKVDVLVEDFEGSAVGTLPDDWTSSMNLNADAIEINAYQVITSVEANAGGYWPVPELGGGNKFVGANDDNLPCDCDFLVTSITSPEMDFSDLDNPAASYSIFHDQGFGGGDGFIEVSTDEGDSWTIVASDACNDIAEFAVSEDVWQNYVTPLPDFAGESSVYVRWTWSDNGSWASGFALDNVVIGDLAGDNLASSIGYYGDWNQVDFGAGVYDFTIIPETQQSEILLTDIISNNGGEEVTGVGFDYSVDIDGTVIGTGASTPVTVGAFCKDTASVATGIVPDASAGSVVNAALTVFSDIADSDPSDDTFTVSYDVSEFIYARDAGAAQAFVQPGDGYQYGNLFDIYEDQDVYGLNIAVAGADAAGNSINAIIYEFEGLDDEGLPILDDVEESEDVEITPDDINNVGDATFITVPFDGGVELEAGKTYLAVMNTSSGDVRTPVSGSNFWVASWLEDGTGWGATASAPMVRLNFDSSIISVDETKGFDFAVEQNIPNPFVDNTRINYNLNNASDVSINIVDVTGKTVYTSYEGTKAAGAHSIVLAGNIFEAGIYQYTITVGGQQITRKMIVQ